MKEENSHIYHVFGVSTVLLYDQPDVVLNKESLIKFLIHNQSLDV